MRLLLYAAHSLWILLVFCTIVCVSYKFLTRQNADISYQLNDGHPVNRTKSHQDAFALDVLNIDHCYYCTTDLAADGQETTLRQVLLTHRHGDRTTTDFPAKDELADEPFWKLYGPGQLTNRGKARMYIMGQMTRKRYEKFLNRSVNKNMRISRSSGSLRCIESAQVFLSALLPLDAQESPDAQLLVWNSGCDKIGRLWQPASILTMPVAMDGMLAESPCKALTDEYLNVIDKSEQIEEINRKYEKERKILEEVMGFQLDRFYEWSWAHSQIEVERSYFGDRVDKRVLDIYDQLSEAGRLASVAYQSTVKSRRLRSGLLISDMIENMKRCRQQTVSPNSGDSPKKLLHYSTHDLNMQVLVGILDNIDRFPFRPDYASNVILELHQDGSEWFVKFFYMPHVPSKLFQIHIKACESSHPRGRCTLETFEKVMEPYVIKNWSSWMKECGNDMSQIDPYAGH